MIKTLKSINFSKKKKILLFLILIFSITSLSLVISANVLTNRSVGIRNEILDSVNFKSYAVEVEGDISVDYDMFWPKSYDSTRPMVAIQHGMGGRKENMQSMALCFVERGFVVITMMLRGHYGAEGVTTLGNQESDDLMKCIEDAKFQINSLTGTNISAVGLVGHSLGAVTVSLTSIKYAYNSCVAISPMADIHGEIFGRFEDGSDNSLEFLNNINGGDAYNDYTDEQFISNITLTGKTSPNNYLIITGENDKIVSSENGDILLKDYSNNNSAEEGIFYGNFSTHNAIMWENFLNASQSSQQYAFEQPEITKLAIEWTENSLNITNPTEITFPNTLDKFQEIETLSSNVLPRIMVAGLFFYFALIIILGLIYWPDTISFKIRPIHSLKTQHHNLKTRMQSIKSQHLKNPFTSSLSIIIYSCMFAIIFKPIKLYASKFLLFNFVLNILYPMTLGTILAYFSRYYSTQRAVLKSSESDPFIKFDPILKRLAIAIFLGIFGTLLFLQDYFSSLQRMKTQGLVSTFPVNANVFFSILQFCILIAFIHQLTTWFLRQTLKEINSKEYNDEHNTKNSLTFTPVSTAITAMLVTLIQFPNLKLNYSIIHMHICFVIFIIFLVVFFLIELFALLIWDALKNGLIVTVCVSILISWLLISGFITL